MAIHLKKLGASRSYRAESGEFLCDGLKLLEDAALSSADIPAVLTAVPIPFPLSVDTRVYYADRGLVDSLSPLKSAQGLLFSCKMRAQDSGLRDQETGDAERAQGSGVGSVECGVWSVELGDRGVGTHILLDSVQDPGNVGAIIRTANAFGARSVVLYGACADVYNPKTIRASMGAIFRQNICKMDLPRLSELKEGGLRFIGAALRKDCRAVFDADLSDAVIAIGSEGAGLSEEILSLCDELVTVPIAAECESLNAAVAAAIIIWEASAAKQRREETGNREQGTGNGE